LASLSATFRDKQRPETERSFATNILTDYASDQPAVVADLLMDAGAKAYSAFFPIAQGHAATTIPLFQEEIAKKPAFSWSDPPLDPSWMKPDAALSCRIEGAAGLLAERFAFCQTLPLDEFLATAEDLRKSGYRPIRFRPYADGPSVRVAAVWTRDGRDWRIASGLTSGELLARDEELRKHDASVRRGSPDPAGTADRRSPASGATAHRRSFASGVTSDEGRPVLGSFKGSFFNFRRDAGGHF